MEKLIQKILLLGAVIGMAFGAFAYLTERPTAVVADLEKKVDQGFGKVYDTMETRRVERDQGMEKLEKRLNDKVEFSTKIVLDRLDKIEDRLHDMQREQKLRSSGVLEGEFDGG